MDLKHILIVEDDPDIVELIEYNLRKAGFQTTSVLDGQKGLKYAQDHIEKIDLLLLDLMLPSLSGLDVCKQLRSIDSTKNLPIIMVTAKGEENDIVLGLEIGADDYLVKPFSPKELIARIKSNLRRQNISNEFEKAKNGTLTLGKVRLNIESFEVFVDNKSATFTLSEFKILKALIQKPDKVFTRSQLLTVITGEGTHIVDRNVDVHIRSLRKKLGNYADMIDTVRGIGYKAISLT